MKSIGANHRLEAHFAGKDPVVLRIYERLLSKLQRMGAIEEEPKKTSIHLVNRTAVAGVATRSNYLILTIKSDRATTSERIHKTEQVSRHRFYHQVKLSSPAEVDKELVEWLATAYQLSS